MEELKKFKIYVMLNYPQANAEDYKYEWQELETTESKERLLQHVHVVKVEEIVEPVKKVVKAKAKK